MTKRKIPVCEPFLGDLETKYVAKAMNEKAISGFFGEFLPKLENDFAKFCDCSYGVAVSSGTTALHLAMVALGIKEGDEVLVSTLTNMATFFAPLYQHAKPVPIDIDPETLNIDPLLLEKKITKKTKAIIVVHLFGHPVDMDPVLEVAKKHNLSIVEDCAEAHGALYKGKKVGSLGDIGCFSFYANKIITTGEGGMITTNNKEYADKVLSAKGLSFGDKNKFMHKDIGFNYRMTNLQAAVGCAQLEKIDQIIEGKIRLSNYYTEKLKNIPDIQLPIEKEYAKNVYWMYHIVLKGKLAPKRDEIMKELSSRGIETREGFIPYNLQDIFIEQGLTKKDECPKANEVAYTSFYLPSSPHISEDDMDYVVANLKEIVEDI